MIITQTPLRISFVGGGSDLASFYKHSYGAVVSTSIDKYIYITVNKKFDSKIRASYSRTEMVDNVSDLQHQLIREALKLTGVKNGIEITSISDIPSTGTGLGSSSSYTVGLINSLRAYNNKISSSAYLAEKACQIEIEKCGEPIGKQDQYAAAYGGLNYIKFNSDGTVDVSPILISNKVKNKLQDNLLMLYTGITRSASKILENQSRNVQGEDTKKIILRQMVQLAEEMRLVLAEGNLSKFGNLLDINWELKKQLAGGISTPIIDEWYKKAKNAGALGGKILGAGGGGFLLLYAPKSRHPEIQNALKDLKSIPIKFENDGSKIIFIKE
ncbi:MAG: GHMP kinase [Patescibacteria group bacterium]